MLGAAGFTEDDLANEEAVIEDREREISLVSKSGLDCGGRGRGSNLQLWWLHGCF